VIKFVSDLRQVGGFLQVLQFPSPIKLTAIYYNIISENIKSINNSINKSCLICLFACLVVFNATFNNISVILWQSVLLVKETGGPGENHRPVASH
jgi:SUMO ligase MMS21 Smc5/6 complex component